MKFEKLLMRRGIISIKGVCMHLSITLILTCTMNLFKKQRENIG